MTINLKGVTSCLGYGQDTTLSTASNLPSIPTKDPVTGLSVKPTIAMIIAETQSVRWRDDGTAPTASVGMLLPVNTPFIYDGDLNKIQFIETTASASLSVSYYC